MKKKEKVVAIFLAYNAAKTLESFYQSFPIKQVDLAILVDDASKDNTYELAKKLGIKSYKNPVNLGYGGNMKKALDLALENKADVIVDIHPDGEYLPTAIDPALKKIQAGAYLVLGNRFYVQENPLKSGMYTWKYYPIIFLNWLAQVCLGLRVSDLHQGFRVYTRKLLQEINYHENSNNYLFSFELIAQARYYNLKISEVPVDTHYTGEKRGASLKNSIRYTLGTFKVISQYWASKLGFENEIFKSPRDLKN